MASLSHCVLILCMCIATTCNAANYSILDFEMAHKHELWMAEYGREYRDEAEKAFRFEIFKENVKYIEDFNNAGNHSYTLGINQFTDLTDEEFATTYARGFEVPDGEFGRMSSSPESEKIMDGVDDAPLPDSVDWRDEGAVSTIKDQGTCESCWAFAAAATIESIVQIKNGTLFDLSPQQLVDCDANSNGCHRGYPKFALEYVVQNDGITTWANYPYTGKDGVCDQTLSKEVVAKIDAVGAYGFSNERMLAWAVARQPVAVGVEAEGKDFRFYKGGIFQGPCRGRSRVNHAVVVVGYGAENWINYWIIKNQWGTSWGESGYMRLGKDVGTADGMCGICFGFWYPIIN